MNVSTLTTKDTVLLADDIHVPNFDTGSPSANERLRRIQGMVFDADSHAERLELVLGQIDICGNLTAPGITATLKQWKSILETEVKNMDSPSTDTAIDAMEVDLKEILKTSILTIEEAASEPKQQDADYITTAQMAKAEVKRCEALIEHCQSEHDKNLAEIDSLTTDNTTYQSLIKGYGMMVKEAGGAKPKAKPAKQGAKT